MCIKKSAEKLVNSFKNSFQNVKKHTNITIVCCILLILIVILTYKNNNIDLFGGETSSTNPGSTNPSSTEPSTTSPSTTSPSTTSPSTTSRITTTSPKTTVNYLITDKFPLKVPLPTNEFTTFNFSFINDYFKKLTQNNDEIIQMNTQVSKLEKLQNKLGNIINNQ